MKKLILAILALASPSAFAAVPPPFSGMTYIESHLVEVDGKPLHRVLMSPPCPQAPGMLQTVGADGKSFCTDIQFGLMDDGNYGAIVEEWTEHFPGFFFPGTSQQLEGTWTASEDGTTLHLDFFGDFTIVKDAENLDAVSFQITRDLLSPGLAGKSVVLKPGFTNLEF